MHREMNGYAAASETASDTISITDRTEEAKYLMVPQKAITGDVMTGC
jgi:hypothetical protein